MFIRSGFLAAILAFTAPSAFGECPEKAVQTLYSVQEAVETGLMRDQTTVFAYAKSGVEQCPEDSTVLGISSVLFAMLAKANEKENAETRTMLLDRAYTSAIASAQHYKPMASPKVKTRQGEEKTLYMYGQVRHALTSTVYPQMVALQLVGNDQTIFSDAPLTACPFPGDQQMAREEVETLKDIAASSFRQVFLSSDQVLPIVSQRLTQLEAVCEQARPGILYALFGLYSRYAHEIEPFTVYSNPNRVEHAKKALGHVTKAKVYGSQFIKMTVTDQNDKINQKGAIFRLLSLSELEERLEEVN